MTVNHDVVGSSPTWGVDVSIEANEIVYGSVVKRLRHRPFTAVTRVRFSSESLFLDSSAVEHPAVNRRVVGSNPTRGAIFL